MTQAITTDVVGRVMVIQDDKITKEWGDLDPKNGIISASFDNSSEPLLALSRVNGWVEIMNPITGESYYSFKIEDKKENEKEKQPATEDETEKKDEKVKKRNTISELFLFRKQTAESPSTLLYCLDKMAMIVSMDFTKGSTTSRRWDAGVKSICCSAVDNSQQHCVFAGKTNGNLCMWKFGDRKNMWKWNSQKVRNESLKSHENTPYTNVTSLTFSSIDSQKIVAGTNNSQVWIFDISSNKHVVIPINKSSPVSPVSALLMDEDGQSIYFGDGVGCLGSVDQRTATTVQWFAEESYICGSIKSIARHPHRPLLGSVGFDGYLRVWDIRSRNIFSMVNVGHKLSSVFFGPDLVDEDSVNKEAPPAPDVSEDEVPRTTGKRKMDPQGQGRHKKSTKSRKK